MIFMLKGDAFIPYTWNGFIFLLTDYCEFLSCPLFSIVVYL